MTGNKVLVVEDDKTLLDVLKYNLVKEGYDVVTANGFTEATLVKSDNIKSEFWEHLEWSKTRHRCFPAYQ